MICINPNQTSITQDESVTEIEAGLRLFHGEGSVFEIRIPNVRIDQVGDPKNFVGYFDSLRLAAEEIVRFDEQWKPMGIYTTLQRLRPEMRSRVTNRIAQGNGSKAVDVEAYQWIMLDFDPKRAKGVSSTEEELHAAAEKAEEVVTWLKERGFPEPKQMMSGNGHHRYLKVDLPVSDDGLVKQFTFAMHGRFSDARVDVDKRVWDPSRITKVPGTTARKGEATEERPHRMARWLNPELEPEVVMREPLEQVIEQFRPEAPSAQSSRFLVRERGRGADLSLPQLEPIRQGCAWMENCHSNAETLSEHDWLAALGIASRCENGNELAHEMSCPFPTYSFEETEKKIQHALEAGPRLCATIEEDGFEGCKTCPNRGIRSPIALGYVPLVLSKATPLRSAQELRKRLYSAAGNTTLVYQNEEFLEWNERKYSPLEETGISSKVYGFLDDAKTLKITKEKKEGKEEQIRAFVSFCPNQNSVNNVIHALKAEAFLPSTLSSPAWLSGGEGAVPVERLLICRNKLVDIESGRMFDHTPHLFSTYALDVDYVPNAPEPEEFFRCLEIQFGHDPKLIPLVQEIFGYIIGGATNLQKMFMFWGPKRSGKGMLARILTALVGEEHVVGPTLSSMAGEFALEQFISAKLAVFPDAHLSNRVDQTVIVERILAITGEDRLQINRKNLRHWNGKLNTRMIVLTNVLPYFRESSGAFASRFIIVPTKESFLDREDTELEPRIMANELPGILNWSIEGWRRLQENKKFTKPTTTASLQRQFDDQTSTVSAFVKDKCVVGPGCVNPRKEIFRTWEEDCRERGAQPGSMDLLLTRLQSVHPPIRAGHRDHFGKKERVWLDIALKGTPGAVVEEYQNTENSGNSVLSNVGEIQETEKDSNTQSESHNSENSVLTVPVVLPGVADTPSAEEQARRIQIMKELREQIQGHAQRN